MSIVSGSLLSNHSASETDPKTPESGTLNPKHQAPNPTHGGATLSAERGGKACARSLLVTKILVPYCRHFEVD